MTSWCTDEYYNGMVMKNMKQTACNKLNIVFFFCPGTFATDAVVIVLYEQNVYTIEQNKVQVRTFQVRN